MANEPRPYLGGSDIAAVVGLSPWKTPLALWQEKVDALQGKAPEDTDSPVKARGRRWETPAREMLLDELAEREMPCALGLVNQRHAHTPAPWMRAEIDAELIPSGLPEIWNAEIKTVSPFASRKEWGEEESDEIPVWYTTQAQWGLMVTGRSICVVGALFGADRLRPYVVERDNEVIAWLTDRATTFWHNHVLADVPPPATNLADLALLYPKHMDFSMQADVYLTQKLVRMRALAAEMKAREAEWDELEFELKCAMGANSALVLPDSDTPVLTWKTESRKVLDQESLKSEHPDIVKALTRTSESRVFRFKPFAMERVMP